MGPRRERRGNVVTVAYLVLDGMLQWGRVVKDAEMDITALGKTPTDSLQWGRVVKDAEIRDVDGRQTKVVRLQWGRVVKDAEIHQSVRGRQKGQGRFNGAAS